MKFNVYNYSSESRQALDNFEQDLIDKTQSLVRGNREWKCALLLSLNGNDDIDKPFHSNASLSLKRSYEVSNKIERYFADQTPKIQKYLDPAHRLRLELHFTPLTENERNNKSQGTTNADSYDSEKNDETSFLPQKPLYNFSQVILADSIKSEIISAINILKYKNLIYYTWGFSEIDPVPKSVLNFYGPPGTGKTMCAHAIANELNKPLLALNYAEIESKYVGEAPKNLIKAFNSAKFHDAVLFFDEADSFLGKRIRNVTQGAEQALNSLRSQMLMLLEQHSGVIIFATNLVSNFDTAFESRILKHIKFELPNKEARMAIISKMMPPYLPWKKVLTDIDLDDMAQISDGLSGREIKGIILETLLDKVSENGQGSMFVPNDFKNRFIIKQEEKKKLKEESDAALKQRITNALQRTVSNENQQDTEYKAQESN